MKTILLAAACLLTAVTVRAGDPSTSFEEGEKARAAGETPRAERFFAQSAEEAAAAGDRRLWVKAAVARQSMLNTLGRFAEALDLSDKAVAEHERLSPGGSLDFADALVERGSVLRNLDRDTEAEKVFRRAVAMAERSRPGSAVHMTALSGLGRSLAGQDRPYEALKVEEQAVAWSRQPGVEHYALADALESSGVGAIDAGRYSLAVDHLKESVDLTSAMVGPSHSVTARRRYKLGWAMVYAGDLSGADAELKKARADLEVDLGPDAPITAGSVEMLGELRRRQRRFDDAVKAFQEAGRVARKIGHGPFLAEIATQLGGTYREMGRPAEAEAEFAAAEKYARGVALGELRREQGLLHEAAGRRDKAVASLKDALVQYAVLGDKHPKVIEARRDLERVSGAGAVQR